MHNSQLTIDNSQFASTRAHLPSGRVGEGVPVHNQDMEERVLSGLLSHNEWIETGGDYLCRELFYDKRHQTVYDAIRQLYDNGEPADIATVSLHFFQQPRDGVDVNFAALFVHYIDEGTMMYYLRCLYELKQRRSYQEVAELASDICSRLSAPFDEQQQRITQLVHNIGMVPGSCICDMLEANRQLNRIIMNNANGNAPAGILTGFDDLDRLGGLQRGDLVVIAAESSQGKTSLACDLCVSAAQGGHPCIFYSVEMSMAQIAARMAAPYVDISPRVMLLDRLDQAQFKRFDSHIGQMLDLPIYFDDGIRTTIDSIMAGIRHAVRCQQVECVFIDYLQVLQHNDEGVNARRRTEEQFFGSVARQLKNIAKELDICVVLLSQLSRERNNPEPTINRLRGSGQIAEAADVVLTIYRPECYGRTYSGDHALVDPRGTALISIAKGRNIGTGEFICGFNADLTHFYPLAYPARLKDDGRKTADDKRRW